MACPGRTRIAFTKVRTNARVSVISLVRRNSLISSANAATVLLSSKDTEPDGNGWHAPEPEPVAIEAEAALVGVATGDRHDEARERERSLFSWAEFMAGEPDEPEQPRGRRRSEAPTLSLFEWALEREQEGALAGAAR